VLRCWWGRLIKFRVYLLVEKGLRCRVRRSANETRDENSHVMGAFNWSADPPSDIARPVNSQASLSCQNRAGTGRPVVGLWMWLTDDLHKHVEIGRWSMVRALIIPRSSVSGFQMPLRCHCCSCLLCEEFSRAEVRKHERGRSESTAS
jgi:hypothetical protein